MKIYIVIILIFISCNFKEKEIKDLSINKIIIPNIKKNKNDKSFNLKNGVLLLNETPYSGIVEDYYSKEKLKSTSVYFQGKKHGIYNGWYISGNKWFQRFYTNGLKTGIHIGWFDNGKPMFKYHFNTNGVYNGSITDWYMNGALLNKFNFKEGREEGSQKTWQPNGKIKANFVTKNGERFGLIGLKKCYSVAIENEKIK
ncbi:toxin-antitoxin system YwqK family antitoxin [Tenacibaculum retecalamus]|uniref:toxin-antitoxin system YwqK family antitoxin n=1 Tax=Tenacibaculum retecalamus TaxID=3018315 RepID=UPI0023D8E5DC|nr:hypothetical protein [Tenacibaculum retecalamus]WBX70179.1 hypothetical protein PG912_07715 [Tenacibaculum retecalamus]